MILSERIIVLSKKRSAQYCLIQFVPETGLIDWLLKKPISKNMGERGSQ